MLNAIRWARSLSGHCAVLYSRYQSNLVARRFVRIFRVDVLVRASNILLLPLYLRLMTQEEYGLYGYLAGIIAAVGTVLNLGLYVPQIKFFSSSTGKDAGTLSFTLNVMALGAVVLFVMLALKTNFDRILFMRLFGHDLDYEMYRWFIYLTLFTNVFGMMLYSYYMAAEEIHTVQIQNTLRLFLVHLVVVAMLYLDFEPHVYTRIKYAGLAEFLVLCLFLKQFLGRMEWHFDWAIARRSLWLGLPIMGGGIIQIFYTLSDRYFLIRHFDLRLLGIYNLALAIASIVTFINISFQSVYAPLFFQEKDYFAGYAKFRRIILYAIVGYSVCGFGLMVLTYMLLRTSVIKMDYQDILYVLPLLIIANIISAIGQLYTNYTTYHEETYIGLGIGVAAGGLIVCLNAFIVPALNVYGAALSSLAAATFTLVCMICYVTHKMRIATNARAQ